MSRIKRLVKSELSNIWLNRPIKSKTIFYESYSGNGMLCHPEALFRHFLDHPSMQNFTHIWVLNDFDRYKEITSKFKIYHNVKFVKYLSAEYYRYLYTSEFLINNVSFPAQFVKRENQVYINTWHGIPLKKMGYDIKGRAVDSKNVVRNFLSADYIISASKSMTETMFLDAYKLRNVYEGTIVEAGSPRTDHQFSTDESKDEVLAELAGHGIELDGRKIVLYAPTWKGSSYFNPHSDAASIANLIEELEAGLDNKRYRVLVKAHQVVSEAMDQVPELKKHLVPNTIPTNKILSISDILITDYSSIFFDFLNENKPIFFYAPDLGNYKEYRDIYFEPSELPGPVLSTDKQLIESITSFMSVDMMPQQIKNNYAWFKTKFTTNDDGQVSARIANLILNRPLTHQEEPNRAPAQKRKILIYAGGMIPNGITTSVLNLLDNIDYDKFDITVLCPFSNKPEIQHNIQQINSNARVMFRFGSFNGSYLSNRIKNTILRKGNGHWAARSKSQRRLWHMEWMRCFGNAKFDHAIDFSGYTPFWGLLFLNGSSKYKSIWLHNDLVADAQRSIRGNKPLKDGLYATFSIYKYFDNLVSVSQGLCEINEYSLRQWAPNANFLWSSNTVNPKKILAKANSHIASHSNLEFSANVTYKRQKSDIMGNLVMQLLGDRPSTPHELDTNQKTQGTPDQFFTYFSAGRLSPEKNHERLIRAFHLVHRKNPRTRLVIAGEGPLRSQLESLIVELGITQSVKLVGHTNNPYQLMRYADVFVLSSDYEGQPMVLLESLVLGLPVITTSFGSVKGALPVETGTIVEPNINALAIEMLNEATNPSIRIDFDVEDYNRRAMIEFNRIINQSH
ncbi:glycosyltransferase [Glutamicibacter protophormiae]|uniref:glycosyltransferase n=1 Tax=Glutamicibacter protophormiae TaxID=37930 RepID=UPI00331F57F1